jgi:SAM-dependent methyltransferase
MFFSVNAPFSPEGVKDYEKRRYGGVDQRIVHRREEKLIRRILKKIIVGSPADMAVLDAPCGYGRFSALLLEHGLKLVSSDLSSSMVERARERSPISGLPLSVVADIKRGLPFKTGVFGSVFSIRFFHHVHQEEERAFILREFCRVSSGWAVVSYYQANLLHALQRILRRKVKRSRTRIKMISRRQFESEVRRSGFRLEKVYPLFRGIHAYHLALLRR